MKHLQILLFLSLPLICLAQPSTFPEYYVYLVKGNIMVEKANAKPQKIKLSQYLYNTEVLTIEKNSEVTLLNREAKLLVLNTAGSVKVKDLARKFYGASPSITKSYLNLVFHELLDPNYDYSKFKQRNLGGIRGGVSRGDECGNLIFPVNELKTSRDSIHFKWRQTSPSSEYSLLIYDSAGKEIVNIAVKDTQQVIDLNNSLKRKTGKFYWLIRGKDATGCEDEQPIIFQLMNKEDEQQLVPSLTLLKGSKDLVAQLQIIDELENNKWVYTASDYYATLVRDNPVNDPLLKSYVLFLLKYGFDEEANAMWQKINLKK